MVVMEGQLVGVEATGDDTAEWAAPVAREAGRVVAAAEAGRMAVEAVEVQLAEMAGWAGRSVGLEARAEASEAVRAAVRVAVRAAEGRPRRRAAAKGQRDGPT